ncbi:MAG: heme exporter protein CcmB [Candidatus Kapaibacterium sp.]
MTQATAILHKEFLTETRSRQSVAALLLFVFNAIFLSVISLAGVRVDPETFSALFWLIMLFSASLGSTKSFGQEEDKGTALYLRFLASPTSVFLGKLLYNIVLVLTLSLFSSLLFLVVFDVIRMQSSVWFVAVAATGSVSSATVMSLCSAMISRSASKGALLPIISFPLLLPIVFLGVDATTMSVVGTPDAYIATDILVMLAYTVVMGLCAVWVFPFVWRD